MNVGSEVGAEWCSTLEPESWRPLPDTSASGLHVLRIRMADHLAAFMRLRVTESP